MLTSIISLKKTENPEIRIKNTKKLVHLTGVLELGIHPHLTRTKFEEFANEYNLEIDAHYGSNGKVISRTAEMVINNTTICFYSD